MLQLPFAEQTVLQAQYYNWEKAKEGGIAVVWRGDREWGSREGFLAHCSSSNPSGKESSGHHFSVISTCPKHSLTEMLLREGKWLQRGRGTEACVDIWGFIWGREREKNPPGAIANTLQVTVFSLAVIFFFFKWRLFECNPRSRFALFTWVIKLGWSRALPPAYLVSPVSFTPLINPSKPSVF